MKEKCCHDLNNINTTIAINSRRFMVYPEEIFGTCKICGKNFCFTKNENDNKYILQNSIKKTK